MKNIFRFIIALMLLVSLTACSGGSDGGTSSGASTTENTAPVANAGVDQNVATTSVVDLNGSASSDADNDALTYAWSITSQPTNATATLSNIVDVNPYFTADLDGNYTISLVVNDGTVDSTVDTVTIIAATGNSAPIANAGIAQNVNTTTTVTLEGNASTDADLDALTYAWTLTSKPTSSDANLTNPTTVNPTFVADLNGSYVVQLIVNDGTVDSAVSTVTVNATIVHNAISYGNIISAETGRVWLDKNLGASQVCTALDDTACYGDYYQWGRAADGHEKTTSATTSTQATDVNNAGSSFITASSTYDYDWAQTADSNGSLRTTEWSKTDGSSICPVGYRVPTKAEFDLELANSAITNQTDAYDKLKLPSCSIFPDCLCAFDKIEFKCDGILPLAFSSSSISIPFKRLRIAFSSINNLPNSNFVSILAGSIDSDLFK